MSLYNPASPLAKQGPHNPLNKPRGRHHGLTQDDATQLMHQLASPEPPIGNPQDTAHLYGILQKQNDITASLIRQQDKSFLPRKEMKVFSNDQIEYPIHPISLEGWFKCVFS